MDGWNGKEVRVWEGFGIEGKAVLGESGKEESFDGNEVGRVRKWLGLGRGGYFWVDGGFSAVSICRKLLNLLWRFFLWFCSKHTPLVFTIIYIIIYTIKTFAKLTINKKICKFWLFWYRQNFTLCINIHKIA